MVSLARRPIVLAILDGWGIAPPSRGNAISLARTPNMDRWLSEYQAFSLQASGENVGLPWHEMGNSEVGHLAIGSGRVIYQDLPRLNKAISDQSFFSNPAFLQAIEHVRRHQSRLHLIGLVSSGGIHSSIDHLDALLELTKRHRLTNVAVHAILDGRDTVRDSGRETLRRLQSRLADLGVGRVATIGGRFYSMDRDHRWERTEAAYRAIAQGQSDRTTDDPLATLQTSYEAGVYDEEYPPTVVTADGQVVALQDHDAVICFNFRPDRMRQLTEALCRPDFDSFDRPKLKNLLVVTMTEYEVDLPVTVAFPPESVDDPLARILSDHGLTQLHIAETEKYAHVTFFFNGGHEKPYPGEDRILIPSAHVPSYDNKPDMSAREIAARLISELQRDTYDFIVVNFANADMVGHTGNLRATIQAVETVDIQLGLIADAVLAMNGILIITADHGNAEEKVNLQSGEISKEHTDNAVPMMLIGREFQQLAAGTAGNQRDLSREVPRGVLSDVAPSILALFGLPIPATMTGQSFVRTV